MNSFQHGPCYSRTALNLDLFGKIELAGQSSPLSKTHWWSRWEVINQLMELFGDVEPFLVENDDLGPKTRTQMLSILQDPTKKASLMVEMAAVVDAGRMCYNVEGDGPLVLECYKRIQAAFASIHVRHYPNTDAVIKRLTAGAPAQVSQHWKLYAQSCIQLGLDYFVNRFTGELSSQLEAFKAARLFVPHKVVHMCPDASSVDSLRAFPFLKSDILIANLKTYLGRASMWLLRLTLFRGGASRFQIYPPG